MRRWLLFLIVAVSVSSLLNVNVARADAVADRDATNAFLEQLKKQRTTDAKGAVQAALQFEQQHASFGPIRLSQVDIALSRIYFDDIKDTAKALATLDAGMARSPKLEAVLPMVVQKYRLLIEAEQYAEGINFFKQSMPKFIEANQYYFKRALPTYLRGVKRGGKPEDVTSVLQQALAAHPALISYPRVGAELVKSLVQQPGQEAQALSYAKLYWLTCDFDEKAIGEATASLQKAWMAKDLNASKSTAFLKAQQDRDAPNPLSDIKPPPQDIKVILAEFKVLPKDSVYTHDYITLQMLQHKYGDAMLAARHWMLNEPQNANKAVMEIARIFKAADANLVRANAFLQYFKTGQGANPMDEFFKEHPAGQVSSGSSSPDKAPAPAPVKKADQ